jgi:RimJ/RimL family protein N-acetyltransferase
MTQPTTRIELADGGVVTVRPLRRGDRAELAAAVERLSERSRYLRFAAPKPRLTERELDHLVAVDHHGSEALVAFDPATGRGIAVARYAPVPGAPRVADVAVTVADEWQGRGLGTALLARLVARAAAEGHVALRASVLAVNRPSLALLRRAGFRLRENGGTLFELELDLRPAPSENGGQARRAPRAIPRAAPSATPPTTTPIAPSASAMMLSVSEPSPSFVLAPAGADDGFAC